MCFFKNIFKGENRALRLRDAISFADELVSSTVSHEVKMMNTITETMPRLSWDYFDESGYIRRGGLATGEDPYLRNRFNQESSDSLPSNRDIPDTRNPM